MLGFVVAIACCTDDHRAMGNLWRVLFDRRAVSGRLPGVRLDHACALSPDRRLRVCRPDSRALQNGFFMSSTTRKLPRVL